MNPNYNSDYDIRLAELAALGGDNTQCYDSVYEIDLAILEKIQGGGISQQVINDNVTSTSTTYSSSKIVQLLADAGFKTSFVDELPATGDIHTIYFVPSTNPATQNAKDEFMWTGSAWEQVGSTTVDLSDYYTKSEVDEKINTISNIANAAYENASTIDFIFSEPYEGAEVGTKVVYNSGSQQVISEYKGEELGWEQLEWDSSSLYFDTVNSVLYAYNTEAQELLEVTIPNTIVVSNLNTDAKLKAIKTAGTYNVIQHLVHATRGSYVKNWVMTVTSIDYDDESYETGDKWYQTLVNNVTILKRTWSATRQTNDGWSNFSTYYKGEIKDTTTSKYYTWSSNKLNDLYENPKGYAFNGSTDDGFAEKYKQDSEDGGQILLNTATGLGSHAEGYSTTASGDYGSHSEGNLSVAIGIGSHVEGVKTTANNVGEHAEGNGNVSHKASDTFGNAGNTAHSVGISTCVGSNTPKNAFEIMQNGDMYVLGVGGYQGTDTKVQNSAIKTLQESISTIELPQDMFRLISKQDGSTISINNAHTAFVTSSYKYSFDGITWNPLSDTAITVDLNRVIYIKGTAGQSTTSSSNTAFFVTTGNFDAYGNLGWLYDENTPNATIYKENTLMGLFREAVISDMDVWCNVQKTQKNVFSGMFYGSHITSSVKFNHIIDCERANAWYRNCTSLVNAYPLYFKNFCYSLTQLYRGCTALKNVYVECDYALNVGNMFTDCTSLENIYFVVHYYVYSTSNFANNVPTTCNVHLTDYAQYVLNNTTLTLTKDISATRIYDNDIQLPVTDTNHLIVNNITYDGSTFSFPILKPTDNITYWNYLLSHTYLYIQDINNNAKFTICYMPLTGQAQVVKAIGVLGGNFGIYECTYDSATDTMTHTFTPIN